MKLEIVGAPPKVTEPVVKLRLVDHDDEITVKDGDGWNILTFFVRGGKVSFKRHRAVPSRCGFNIDSIGNIVEVEE